MTELTTTLEKLSSSALHVEKSDRPHSLDPELQRIAELSAKLENPLSGFSTHDLVQQAEQFCQAHGLNDKRMLPLPASLPHHTPAHALL